MRYSSVALIKLSSITLLSPKLSSKSTLCNPLDLVPNLLSQSHPVVIRAFNRFQHCFSPRIFASSWTGRYQVLVPKDFSILFLRILDNITKIVPTHECLSLTQQMNHIQSSRPSINEELSSYLLPSPVEVMVAESQCYYNILPKTLLAYFPMYLLSELGIHCTLSWAQLSLNALTNIHKHSL